MTAYCPDCYAPVDVSPTAREGRCRECRPQRKRPHSQPRAQSDLTRFITEHNRGAAR